MASFSGLLYRPLSAVAVVAVTAVSSALTEHGSSPFQTNQLYSVASAAAAPFPSSFLASNKYKPSSNVSESTFASSPFPIPFPAALFAPYQYAKLSSLQKQVESPPAIASSQSDVLYRWHLPHPTAYGISWMDQCSIAKSQTVVVLLGWLGARQKHLRRYADWYTSRGFHVVTFTFPMADVINYKVGGKVERDVEALAEHLVDWVSEEKGKKLVFHTFSNTGWLTYGVLLEKFREQDSSVIGNIKGCIVDSAPVAAPDAQVWASGFSAALLKKQSVATRRSDTRPTVSGLNIIESSSNLTTSPEPTVIESALLLVLEKFFKVVLNSSTINRRLCAVLDILTSEQPKCPQLYIYSSADQVIPAKSVESFVERQRRAGLEVRACDFLTSPHVDHFRNNPALYNSQLANFLDDCVLTCCKGSS
ncbi:transmembrane protein 53-like [Zingiber officinale]|nr:transmembrane protein 53-like [Zingiber officinale]